VQKYSLKCAKLSEIENKNFPFSDNGIENNKYFNNILVASARFTRIFLLFFRRTLSTISFNILLEGFVQFL